jgi:hypothetical protein
VLRRQRRVNNAGIRTFIKIDQIVPAKAAANCD